MAMMSRFLQAILVLVTLLPHGGICQNADRATEAPLVVEILDPDHPRNAGRLQAGRPPVVFDGKQIRDLDHLRERLRIKANPRRYPDKENGEVGRDRTTRKSVYPSSKSLLVRCDGTQMFGWVQAILQYCTFIPGRPQQRELVMSPLIYRVSLELAHTGRVVKTYLPTDRGLTAVARERPQAEIIVKVARSDWAKPCHERTVIFMAGGSAKPLGQSRGLGYHSTRPGHYSMLLDPSDTLLRTRRYLGAVRQRGPKAIAKLNAYARTPIGIAFEMVEIMKDVGYEEITYSGVPSYLVRDLMSGKLAAPSGVGALLDRIKAEPVPAPSSAGGGGGAGAGRAFLGGRRPGGRRNLRAAGGNGKTADAVERGLQWLARHQSRDGRWDCDGFMSHGDPKKGALCDGKGHGANDVGVSGLSLLAFLGSGNTHREGVYKQTVRQGLKWLKGQQDAEGCFGPRENAHFTYNHGIGALAMAEGYGMTRSGIWKASAQNGINFVMKCQNPYKAWRYGERPGDNDISVSAWMVSALNAANAAGLDVDDNAMKWARAFVDEMTDPATGRTGYTRRGERPVRAQGRLQAFPGDQSESLTGAAMVMRMFAGEEPKKSAMIRKGAALLSKLPPRWQPEGGGVDMYYWYWGTMAMFQIGGDDWEAWNTKMKPAIIDHQRDDGNFAGSWDNLGPWGADGGRVYSTAMMTLCMEVYYRYSRVFGSGK